MPTAIFDIDLLDIPPVIEASRHYSHALVLIRLRNRPVGQIRLPLINGKISGEEIIEILLLAIDKVTSGAPSNTPIFIDKETVVEYDDSMILWEDEVIEYLEVENNNDLLNTDNLFTFFKY